MHATIPVHLHRENGKIFTIHYRDGFCLAFNQKHWSDEAETIRLIEDLLVPYIKKVKEEKALPQPQKSLLVWDAFKTQSIPKVMVTLSSYGVESDMAPKNMTQLLQLLDLTTIASIKKCEKRTLVNISRLVLWKL